MSLSPHLEQGKIRFRPYPLYLAQGKIRFRPYPLYLAERELFMPNKRDMDTFHRPRRPSGKASIAFHQVRTHLTQSYARKRRRMLSISPIFAPFSALLAKYSRYGEEAWKSSKALRRDGVRFASFGNPSREIGRALQDAGRLPRRVDSSPRSSSFAGA